MSAVATRLQEQFARALEPLIHCEIVNESFMHKVPKGSETHFKVIVVSEKFAGLSPIQRHRLVYASVQDEFQNAGGTVHALSINAKTPAEWQAILGDQDALSQAQQRSPPCLGGDKKLA